MHVISLVCIFFLYAGLVLFGVAHHEPWFDEAQAWLLSRDSQPWDLFNHYLRYEGTPGLWHLILGLAAKSGGTYASMNLIGAVCAMVGVLIFLIYAPFPLFFKIIFPFSYFMFYQYAVVARSYVLMPALLFSIAALYRRRFNHLWAYALLLALLSNLSIHGLIISFSLACLDLFHLWPQRKQILSQPSLKWTLMFAYGLVLAAGLLAIWQVRFPSDHAFVQPKASYSFRFVRGITGKFLVRAFTERPWLSYLIGGISLWHFWKTRTLSLFLLPFILIGHLFALAYANVWHEGIIFLLWVFCLWISLERSKDEPVLASDEDDHDSYQIQLPPWHRMLVLLGLLIVLAIQLEWSYKAFRNDLKSNYSAAEEVAVYLKKHAALHHTIYATGFHSIAILPYFEKNIFSNYGYSHQFAFWDWSLKNDMVDDLECIVLQRPEVIVLGIKTRFVSAAPEIPGYVARKFTGYLYWKSRTLEEDSYVVYERMKHRLQVVESCGKEFLQNTWP